MSGLSTSSFFGRNFGPYTVIDTLGDGGTGIVMRARNISGEHVALKIPKGEYVAARSDLRREVGVLSRLNRSATRGVLRVIQYGIDDDVPWYAMPLVEGPSLNTLRHELWNPSALGEAPERIPSVTTTVTDLDASDTLSDTTQSGPHARESPVWSSFAAGDVTRALELCLGVSEVLAGIHRQGVVHGDLSPSNILYRAPNDPVLIDFGASQVALEVDLSRELPLAGSSMRGTPGYLSPEVIGGELGDARSDLYALGCIIYELVAGVRPFVGVRIEDVLLQHLRREPPRLSTRHADVSPALEALVSALLEKEPGRRLARAEQVTRVLSALLGRNEQSAEGAVSRVLYRAKLRGRAEPMSRLSAAVDAATAGRGGFAIVSGVSGVGKTRMLNELGRRAATIGMRVCWCRAEKTSFSDPEHATIGGGGGLSLFKPVIELARGISLASEQQLEALTVLDHFDPGSRLVERTGGANKQRTYDALLSVARGAAGTRGLLILVDDIQWADELSLGFLTKFAARLETERVLIVANCRSDEAFEGAADVSANAHLSLLLDTLGPDETRAATRDLLGIESLPDGLAEYLHRQSDGNPLLLTEYLRACIADSVLAEDEAGAFRFDSRAANEQVVPRSLEALLALRLSDISARAKAALEVGSILGREFDSDTMAAVLRSTAEASEALEELAACQILTSAGSGRFRFVHDKLREIQERALPDQRRHEYHRDAALHIESLGEKVRRERVAELGHHWASTGASDRALDYLELAAADATETFALQRATDLYRLCLRACAALADSEQRAVRTARNGEAFADVLISQAKHAEARSCLETVLLTRPEPDQLGRARALRKLGASYWTVHEYEVAERCLADAERALGEPTEASSRETWVELIQIRLGRFERLYFSGKTGPELDALVLELGPLVEQRGTPSQRSMYCFIAASNLLLRRGYAFDVEAVALAERGLVAAQSLPPLRQAFAHFMVAFTLLHGDRACCERSLEHFQHAEGPAKRADDATLLSRIRVYYAIALLRLGRVDAVAHAATLAAESAELARMAPYAAAARMCHGWVAWRRSRAREARQLLESARAMWRGQVHKLTFTNLALFPLVALAQAEADLAGALQLLGELEQWLPVVPDALAAVVREATTLDASGAAQEASAAIDRSIALACELGFA